MNSGKLEALITPPEAWTANLTEAGGGGAQVVTIAPADIAYWSSAPAGDDMVTRIKDALEAASFNGRTYIVNVDATEGGTGKMVITVVADTFALAWVDTDWRDLCGWDGDIPGGSAGYESDHHVQGLWLPNNSAQITLVGAGHKGKYESDARAMVTRAGHVWTLGGFQRRVLEVQWEGVKRAKTHWITGDDANESFERFRNDAIIGEATWTPPGDTIRLHWDADDDAVYMTGKVTGEQLAELMTSQNRERSSISWTIPLGRFVEVP